MNLIEKVIGSALVLTGGLFLTGAMPRIAGWLLQTFPALGSIG
jgi:cytochrome c-type biogenesis protein